MNKIICIVCITSIIEGVVLDPALYLAPSPPLSTTNDNDATIIWSLSMKPEIKNEEAVHDLPDENLSKSEVMDQSETLWPSYRSTSLKGIHIPLSFHLSGSYGGGAGSGMYGSSYISLPGSYGNSGKAVLAGTNYKSFGLHPGLRIYGSDNKPSWSGWGNGKWGHYGKG